MRLRERFEWQPAHPRWAAALRFGFGLVCRLRGCRCGDWEVYCSRCGGLAVH